MTHKPLWRTSKQQSRYFIPEYWRPWLLDEGSLTQRLIEKSQGQFSVKLLSQKMQRPTLNEARLLAIPPQRLALVREVILLGNHQPWVFARSVLPLSTLTGRLTCLRKLDNRPLGAMLFADKTMTRSNIEVAELSLFSLPTIVFEDACQHGSQTNVDRIWGRRSIFHLSNKPLLVSEFFLPQLSQSL